MKVDSGGQNIEAPLGGYDSDHTELKDLRNVLTPCHEWPGRPVGGGDPPRGARGGSPKALCVKPNS